LIGGVEEYIRLDTVPDNSLMSKLPSDKLRLEALTNDLKDQGIGYYYIWSLLPINGHYHSIMVIVNDMKDQGIADI